MVVHGTALTADTPCGKAPATEPPGFLAGGFPYQF
jgi:hypothetical protein